MESHEPDIGGFTPELKEEIPQEMTLRHQFDRFVIEAVSMEGGTIIDTQLMVGTKVVDHARRVVAGEPGSSIHAARVRRAIKRIVGGAYPKA